MLTRLGYIDINKTHDYSEPVQGFRISPYLQSLMTYAGVNDVYASSKEFFETLLRLNVSPSQVYRVTNTTGNNLSEEFLYEGKTYELPDEIVYGMVDGSMIQTDDGWKEVKVGRIFSEAALVPQGSEDAKERLEVVDSDYCAYQGTCEEFKPKFESLLSKVKDVQLVFISDGSAWIGQWLLARYPNATHILDFYHAVEHLSDALKLVLKPAEWLDTQKELLRNSELDKVIDNIKNIKHLYEDKQLQIIQYYENNRYRMDYKAYLERGLCIGSGAIEAAHRTLIQKRMKLSGQWWGKGTHPMIKLRVAFVSNKQHIVNQLFTNAA